MWENGKNRRRSISTADSSRSGDPIDDRPVRMEMGRAEPIGTTSADINHRNPVVKREKGCNTRTSQEVTHPSTTLAQARLTAEF